MKRGPKPDTSNSPKPIQGVPDAPKHLDATARRHWTKIGKQLDNLGVWSQSDADTLELYCVLFSRWREAEAQVKEQGMVSVSPNGYARPNPYLSIAIQTVKQLNQLANALGLNPVSRSKINASNEEPIDDKWSDFDT